MSHGNSSDLILGRLTSFTIPTTTHRPKPNFESTEQDPDESQIAAKLFPRLLDLGSQGYFGGNQGQITQQVHKDFGSIEDCFGDNPRSIKDDLGDDMGSIHNSFEDSS